LGPPGNPPPPRVIRAAGGGGVYEIEFRFLLFLFFMFGSGFLFMATANLNEMADVLGVSVPTLRETIKKYPDLPILARGSNGVPWQFDPEAVTRFLLAQRQAEERAATERFAQLDQFRLPIDDMPEESGKGFTPQQELAIARKRLLDQQFAKEAGFLVQTGEARQVISAALAKFSRAMLGLPEQMGRRHGWRDVEVREATESMETYLNTLIEELMMLGPKPGPGDGADGRA